jgi:hypothetical protein
MGRQFAWKRMLVVVPMLLAACGASTTVNGDGGSFSISDGKVLLRPTGSARAEVSADGSLAIDGKPVELNDAQRADLVRYHAKALEFIDHAKDTGAAGAAVGVAAVKEVASGLASGDTSKIGERVEAKADVVRQAADKLCSDLEAIVALQATIGAELEAFRPYAVIGSKDPAECHKGIAKEPAKDVAGEPAKAP